MIEDRWFVAFIKRISFYKAAIVTGIFLFLLGSAVFFNPLKDSLFPKQEKDQSQGTLQSFTNADESKVLGLGASRQTSPQIYISATNEGYSSTSGGVISLASTDEAAIQIGGYNISGTAEIVVYRANEDMLLDYLLHDKEGKQIKKAPDANQISYVTAVKHDINTATAEGSRVVLPLDETGIWYLQIKIGSMQATAYILRSNTGVLVKEADDEFLFWGQNFKTKRSITEATIRLFNLQDTKRVVQTVSFNSQGIAKSSLTSDADIAIVSQGNDIALIPLNLRYLNLGYASDYKQFQPKGRLTRYFIFTDRPLYQPGDIIYFKAIARDDDDARYSIPSGSALVKIYPGYDDKNVILERNIPISADGTITGQYALPAEAKVGYYNLSITLPSQRSRTGFWDAEYAANSISFDVEFFRKPEFSIDITIAQTEYIAGDKAPFTIKGNYFSGQPLLGQSVKYSVYAANFYEYEYLSDQQSLSNTLNDDYRYGSWYGSNKVMEGIVTLDNNGEAVIDLDTKMSFNGGKTQIFSIEAASNDGSQDPSFSRKNILVYAGEYGIFKNNTSYTSQVNTVFSLPLTLRSYRSNSSVSGVSLQAKVKRENWIAYREDNKKYPSYRKEEEDMPVLTAVTDSSGKAVFSFTATKTGSYTLLVEGKDARGNSISKSFYTYVTADDIPIYTPDGNSDLTIASDKKKYLPTDTATFTIHSVIPNRDVFLTMERGRVNRYQIVHIQGENASISIPLVTTDVPNIYATVSSFSDFQLDANQVNVLVSSQSKKILVKVSSDSPSYGPSQTVTLNLATTDASGNPISADVALWAVDKAIFELSDNKLGDIFKTFWFERSDSTQQAHSLQGILVNQAEGGGCFAQGTDVLTPVGTAKIEEIHAGDFIVTRSEKDPTLVRDKVLSTHMSEVSGYLIINDSLKVTANHILYVNGKWREAGSIQLGDSLIDKEGQFISVSSLQWQQGKFRVYNLEIEKYHTYFAGGVWVHNQKGVQRSVFKDTAYWNPSIHTDISGHAQVHFQLPDNLTTWTLAAVASTVDSRVGQTTTDITVTKDVIVRPILPNILRVGDKIVLSALVQNFTPSLQSLDVDLQFDSGDVSQATYTAQIKSQEMKQFYWMVVPTRETDTAKLTFVVRSSKGTHAIVDSVQQSLPVFAFGFEEQKGEAGEGDKTFFLQMAADADKDKSSLRLILSPTILGVLPTAMNYLIDYPYGCVEQTTSRFVPAVIAKANSTLFSQALQDKKIDEIIKKGLDRLALLQQPDGGWAWWFSGKSDPFITAYVVEYILDAKQLGAIVDADMFSRAISFLHRTDINIGNEDQIAKAYALTLTQSDGRATHITNLANLSPDILSLAVMTNYLNGDTNPKTNGLSQLSDMAQNQGDAVFWQAGNKLNFGSKDASTALAMRAILLTHGDRDLATKAARYLVRVRKAEYWSNTYATAQVIAALVEFSKTGNELTPNYSYGVSLDGKQIASATVVSSAQNIPEILLPMKQLLPNGSSLVVTKQGEGQLYSTLLYDEFHTDKSSPALSHGLSITREYENSKGKQYSLVVGDTALVKLTLSGLSAGENYGVIHDELPAGMVPINESFKNEQYGDSNTTYYGYDNFGKEVTKNGMNLSLYQVGTGSHIYTYKARVISEGSFIVPPATASLMYAPEVYGRSTVGTITIGKVSEEIPVTKSVLAPASSYNMQLSSATRIKLITISVVILAAIYVWIRRSQTKRP